MARFVKGGVAWNKGTKGLQVAWNKGLTKDTSASMKKISNSIKGVARPWVSKWNSIYKKGRHCSDSQKDKLSKSMKAARASYAPVWNKGLTKKTSASLRKMAKSLSKALKGKPKPFRTNKQGIRRFWYYGKTCRIKMRSRWEVAYAHYLDKKDIDWLYEYCSFVMDEFSYTPDFWIREENVFHEIKGFTNEAIEKKLSTFIRHFGCSLKVLMGKELTQLGVLDKHGRVATGKEA